MNELDPRTQEVFESVQKMYNEHPFPNVRQHPSQRSDDRFKHIYKKFLGIDVEEVRNDIMLDAGCGTGENTWSFQRMLSSKNRILALDLSLKSLCIAKGTSEEQPENLSFINGSLMDLGFKDSSFDFVFCSGVLVAIPDPFRAFQELVRVLRPGGVIVLILYHRYGRLGHIIRRGIVRLLAGDNVEKRARVADRLFKKYIEKLSKIGPTTYEATLYDQYGLPSESSYSFGQALSWYEKAQINYQGSWPPIEFSKLQETLVFSMMHPHLKKKWLIDFLGVFKQRNLKRNNRPGLVGTTIMELLWMLDGLQLFSISGIKQ